MGRTIFYLSLGASPCFFQFTTARMNLIDYRDSDTFVNDSIRREKDLGFHFAGNDAVNSRKWVRHWRRLSQIKGDQPGMEDAISLETVPSDSEVASITIETAPNAINTASQDPPPFRRPAPAYRPRPSDAEPIDEASTQKTLFGMNYWLAIYMLVGIGFVLVVAAAGICLACRRHQRRHQLQKGAQKLKTKHKKHRRHFAVHRIGSQPLSLSSPSLNGISNLQEESVGDSMLRRRDSDDDDGDWRYGEAVIPMEFHQEYDDDDDDDSEDDFHDENEEVNTSQRLQPLDSQRSEKFKDLPEGQATQGTERVSQAALLVDSSLRSEDGDRRSEKASERVRSSSAWGSEYTPYKSRLSAPLSAPGIRTHSPYTPNFQYAVRGSGSPGGRNAPVTANLSVLRTNRNSLFTKVWDDDPVSNGS